MREPWEPAKIERWVAAWRPWARVIAVVLGVGVFGVVLWSSFEIIEALQ